LAGAAIAEMPRRAAAAALALILAEAGGRALVYLDNFSAANGARSTRAAAADWIDQHIPDGAQVGVLRPPEPSHTPPFRWNRVDLTIFESPAALAATAPPEWIAASVADLEPLAAWTGPRYELAQSFEPSCPWGLCPTDDSFFANIGIRVLRRRGNNP
jgi:hypothetical protein